MTPRPPPPPLENWGAGEPRSDLDSWLYPVVMTISWLFVAVAVGWLFLQMVCR